MSADEIAKGVAEAKEIDPTGDNVTLDESLTKSKIAEKRHLESPS
jgi:hypothetical protein